MKQMVIMRRYVRKIVFGMAFFGCGMHADESEINFDELLGKTSYGVLLKELISLSDTIGLLHCRMEKDERRFVEDSILGKTVRVQDLFAHIDLGHLQQNDIEYLSYWIELAKGETLPELLSKYIADLEQVFSDACARSLYYQG